MLKPTTNKKLFEQYAQMGKALSNQNRLEILSLVMQSKKTVEAIAKETNLSIANVSKHLQALLKARLVKNQKYKNYIFYEIFDESIQHLLTLFFETAQEQINKVDELRELFLASDQEEYVLTMDELESKLRSNEVILLDVRPAEEYCNAHIPGAISMPVEELEQLLEKLPKDKPIVAYCRGPHCLMSKEAIDILEKHGHEAVRFHQSVSDWEIYKKNIAS